MYRKWYEVFVHCSHAGTQSLATFLTKEEAIAHRDKLRLMMPEAKIDVDEWQTSEDGTGISFNEIKEEE
jgi:hypothetical protein